MRHLLHIRKAKHIHLHLLKKHARHPHLFSSHSIVHHVSTGSGAPKKKNYPVKGRALIDDEEHVMHMQHERPVHLKPLKFSSLKI
jgi:hypothetical protein